MTSPPDPTLVRFDGPWRHFDVRANGLRFHAVETQRFVADRPLVLLLHGFGEFWWSWRNQLEALTDAGYRAVAVDLRGYGDSDKPPRGYDGWTLAGDTHALIRALGHSTAALVGHADGGLVCWATATLHPAVVSRVAVLSSPHPRALKHGVLRNAEERSAFLGPFLHNQLPRLGERRLTVDDGAFIAEYFRERSGAAWRQTDDFAEAVSRNRMAIQIPGVAHCSLEYRRWAFRSQFRTDGWRFMDLMNKRLRIPVLAVRGRDDAYILDSVMAGSRRWASTMDYRMVSGAGHFAHQEKPDEFNALLLELLSGP
ncbi:alpha/beta fold hydrolase [Gordonia hydrophobica]|uniref:Alpha/beta hydrolase n=1 Tax=Gordonia hydrophobica TaxID=40516 RepID=A0ABZ2U4L8_9ACTN|nr:alpha/beta hydrolase [Gordonia hydrophobica]MBM7368394.1 pimeloyl-ACP methyl ester carboxylesterase [Gordonia hydrophobica]